MSPLAVVFGLTAPVLPVGHPRLIGVDLNQTSNLSNEKIIEMAEREQEATALLKAHGPLTYAQLMDLMQLDLHKVRRVMDKGIAKGLFMRSRQKISVNGAYPVRGFELTGREAS